MEPSRTPRQKQGLAAMDAAIALMAVLLLVQMWVLTAALEAFLAGHEESALPTAIVSGLITLSCWGLYRLLQRADRNTRSE